MTARKISLTHVSFAELAAELARRLEAAQGEDALVIAGLGRELEQEFSRWGIAPPSAEERRRSINALADWQRRACEFLAAKKEQQSK